jgi:hypothetical protein
MFYLEKLKKDYNIDLNLILIEKEEYLGGKIHLHNEILFFHTMDFTT